VDGATLCIGLLPRRPFWEEANQPLSLECIQHSTEVISGEVLPVDHRRVRMDRDSQEWQTAHQSAPCNEVNAFFDSDRSCHQRDIPVAPMACDENVASVLLQVLSTDHLESEQRARNRCECGDAVSVETFLEPELQPPKQRLSNRSLTRCIASEMTCTRGFRSVSIIVASVAGIKGEIARVESRSSLSSISL